MARAPLLQLNNISLTFGGTPLFENISLMVQPNDKIAMVGRNGSGKSTLLKIMAGQIEADRGSRIIPPGITVGYMEQDPDMANYATVGDFALAGLPKSDAYRVDMAAEGLKFDPAKPIETASGGERRRACMAKLMAQDPEVMLLDEPTNHLDIEAIEWLEQTLQSRKGAFVLISHDRAFLNKMTKATLWMDRGIMRRQNKGFEHFEDWRDQIWAEEDLDRHKLNRKIKAEARWAVEGISARRKRNMGRMRALQDLRLQRNAMIKRAGTAAFTLQSGQQSGRKVIEAKGLNKGFADKTIVTDFSISILRKDRVAFVGPNGVGKTTVLKMLLGEIELDSGSVKHGTNLEIAVFDQNRSQLNPEDSLWDALTSDPTMAVQGRSDQVMVRDTPCHVVGYLKDFLFTEEQARAPVKSLSGGERARLLLAKLVARESNLLVFDEPTNDFDIETLDLLEDILSEYDGTCLIVSHDRDFLDRVATTTIALEGKGVVTTYAGGWSDYQTQKALFDKADVAQQEQQKQKPQAKQENAPAQGKTYGKLTFTEKHRLQELPDVIDTLNAEIQKLSGLISSTDLYNTDRAKFDKASKAIADRQAKLSTCEAEWVELVEKEEGG